MDREARIEALVNTPPRVVLTPWQKFERVVTWVTTIVATVAFILSLSSLQKTAMEAKSSKAMATCINSALEARRVVTLAQTQAARDYAKATLAYNQEIESLLNNPPRTQAQKEQARHEFTVVATNVTAATADWLSRLQSAIGVSLAVPLGQC